MWRGAELKEMIISCGHTSCPLHLLRCQASEDVIEGVAVKLLFQQLYASCFSVRSPKGNFISSRKNVPTHQSGGVGDGLGPAVREGDLVGAGGSGAVPVLVGSEVHQAGVVLHIENVKNI